MIKQTFLHMRVFFLGFVLTAFALSMAPDQARAETETDEKAAEERADWPEPRRQCVNIRRVRNFSVIDNRHVVLYETRRRAFLLTVAGDCIGLRFAIGLKPFTRFGPDLCGFAGDRLLFRRSRFCFVTDVERVESLEHARFVVEQRKGEDDEMDEIEADEEGYIQALSPAGEGEDGENETRMTE